MTFQPTNSSARPRIAVPADNYVPSVTTVRAGADDHKGIPSVVNGAPVAHKAPASLGSKVQRFANLR